MNEASKTLLMNAVKEWSKFVNERERMRAIAAEVSAITQKVVLDTLTYLKGQNIDVECADVNSMRMMGHPVVVEPVVEATFPNVKTRVNMTCSGATRSIVINPNTSISAGGNPFMFDQFKKGIPESFLTNAAEFVADAFLFVARNQTPEEQAAQQQPHHPATPQPVAPAPASMDSAPRPAPAAPPQQPKPAPAPKPAQAAPQPPKPPAPQQPRPAQPAQPQRPPGPKPPGT